MRKPIPAVALTALALASAAAFAAPAGSVLGNPGRTTVAPLVTTPGTPTTQTSMGSGAFSPSAPNTVAAAPNTSSTSGTSTSGTSASGTTSGSNGTTASGPAAANVTTNPASSNANPNPFGPNTTFANDNNNAQFGITPGFATSAGTIGPNGATPAQSTGTTLGNGVVGNGVAGNGVVAPVDVTGGVAYGMPDSGAAPSYSSNSSANVAIPATTNTPLLNQVTNTEINKEARERAQGRTPRVIGIAPRTNVDRTNQMPDDPIIRY